MQTTTELHDAIEPIAEGTLALAAMQHGAVAEDHLGVIAAGTIREAQHEQLQRCRLEKQILIFDREFQVARYLLGKLPDHIHGAGQQVIELLHLIRIAHAEAVQGAGDRREKIERFLVVCVVQAGGIGCCVHMTTHQGGDERDGRRWW